MKKIEKIEFQSPESKIQDSKILRRSFRVILESRVRRLKKIEKIEFQSPESKIQDSKMSRRSFRAILESMVTRLNFNLFNFLQSPDPGFQDCFQRSPGLESRIRRLKKIEKIEFQSPEPKIQDSKILRRSCRAILESMVTRLNFNLFNSFNLRTLDSKIAFKDLLDWNPGFGD